MNSKILFQILAMLVISAISMPGLGQTEQPEASITTTTTTTAAGSTFGSTTTATTTMPITLYDGYSFLIPSGIAHIIITKQSNADLNEYIYKITIEDPVKSACSAGFTPKDVSVTFSVDNNVYIEYDDMKIEYCRYGNIDIVTGVSNYVTYNPSPCEENLIDFGENIISTAHPVLGVVLTVYNIFKLGGESIGCLSYLYDWSVDVSVDGNKIESHQETGKIIDKYKIISKIVGEDEDERNNRRVENMVYSKDPRSEIGVAPRSVVITIPVHPKDHTIKSDMRMWIDIRGYLSGARNCDIRNTPGNIGTDILDNIGANMVYSLATNSIGIYFENEDMFQIYSEPPTGTDVHPPILSDPKVDRDCASEDYPFIFSVVYKDEDGDEAKDAYIRIVGFDGTSNVYDTLDDINLGKMIRGDGEPSTGIQYTYTTILPRASEYYYMFYFSNQNGKNVYLPLEGFSSPVLGYTVPIEETSCGEAATTSKEVVFPDPNLEAAIRAAINKPYGPIYVADLEQIERLEANESDIKDITGLEYCTNLQTLYLGRYLGRNQITDVSPLAGLTNLQTLGLWGNQITDVSPLAGLTNLETLDLGDNQITDVSPLAGLTNLQILWLEDNQITDVSPLAGLTNLQTLGLWGNQITDVSPLAGLTKLQRLWLGGNQITDVSPLAGLTNLQTLGLWGNQITDVSPLAGLTYLQYLDLEDNQITDVSPLAGLTNLQILWLGGNEITDVSALSELTCEVEI